MARRSKPKPGPPSFVCTQFAVRNRSFASSARSSARRGALNWYQVPGSEQQAQAIAAEGAAKAAATAKTVRSARTA